MTPDAGFELFDHTADMGVRAFAPSMPELVEPAVKGLYAVIGELAAGAAREPFGLDRTAAGRSGAALLLRDFLAELLVMFEADQRIAVEIVAQRFDDEVLSVRGWTAPVDAAQSEFHREAKAITYHELEIRPTERGYEITYIVDI